jgi:molybdopterin converting factor subunit 1
MRVEVLLFASLRDLVGPTFAVDVADGADVGALRAALEAAHPAFAKFGRRAAVAVNEVYARDEDPIRPGDVVAVLPPVAGG